MSEPSGDEHQTAPEDDPEISRTAILVGRFVLVALALVLGLLMLEILFRVATPPTQFLDDRTDEFWKAELRHRQAEEKQPAVDVEFDSLLGWRMKRNYRADGIHHNSIGLRASREFGEVGEATRVLLLGASMTYGLGVRDEETYGAKLETRTGFEVMNAGVNAYGADQALLFWEAEGRKLDPDLVIFEYHVDSFYRNGLSVRDGPRPHFVRNPATGEFELRGVPVPTVEEFVEAGGLEASSASRLADALRWLARKVRRDSAYFDYEGLPALRELDAYILKRLRDSVDETGAGLVVLITGHCYDGSAGNAVAEQEILRETSRLGIETLDTLDVMRRGDFGSYYGGNCHWSPAGHELVAAELADYLAAHPPVRRPRQQGAQERRTEAGTGSPGSGS